MKTFFKILLVILMILLFTFSLYNLTLDGFDLYRNAKIPRYILAMLLAFSGGLCLYVIGLVKPKPFVYIICAVIAGISCIYPLLMFAGSISDRGGVDFLALFCMLLSLMEILVCILLYFRDTSRF